MKYLFIFLIFSTPSFASTLVCDKIVGDGVYLKNTKAYIDLEQVLLTFKDAADTKPIITNEFVSPYDLPAFQYDRKNDCTLTSSQDGRGNISHDFVCLSKNEVNTYAKLLISSDKKNAVYSGIIHFPSEATLDFEAVISKCKAQ